MITPRTLRFTLLLTATSPISHHDPAVTDDSNRNQFNRQALLVNYPEHLDGVTTLQAHSLCEANPIPHDLAQSMKDLAFPDFVACGLIKLFADEYNSMDGHGLFSGMERWQQLEKRVKQSASKHTLGYFWNALCGSMLVNLPSSKMDSKLMLFFGLPQGTQNDVLHSLRSSSMYLTMIARMWHDTSKKMSDGYREKSRDRGSDLLLSSETLEDKIWSILTFSESQLQPNNSRQAKLEVPHFTANSARHQLVREPAWHHLIHHLQLEPESLPAGVEGIFYNGGNIAAGAKQPSNPSLLARQIRAAFPSLDLLGGVTDSFDLGESMLTVKTHLVCKEKQPYLGGFAGLPNAQISAFDMFDEAVMTRQAGKTGLGQMIYGFEALAAGTQVLVHLELKEFSPQSTLGALAAAIKWYSENIPRIGGGSARGFGHVAISEFHAPDGHQEALQVYEQLLENHRDQLKAELTSGKLGASSVVLS